MGGKESHDQKEVELEVKRLSVTMKRRLIKMLNAVRKRFIARRRLVRRVSVTRGKLIIMRSSVEWRWQLTTVRRV